MLSSRASLGMYSATGRRTLAAVHMYRVLQRLDDVADACEGYECSDTHSLRLICPTRFLRESTRAEIACIRHGPLEGQPCKMCNNDTRDEVKHVVLLRGQDADCEKCPLKPEDEYRKFQGTWEDALLPIVQWVMTLARM